MAKHKSLSSVIQDIENMSKLAESDDPGQVGGKSKHPTATEDSGVQTPPEGDRSKENSRDIEESLPGLGVTTEESIAQVDQTSAQVEINHDNRPTGEDPQAETASAKDLPEDEQVGGSSKHPARADNTEIKTKMGSLSDQFRHQVKQSVDSSNKILQLLHKEAGLATDNPSTSQTPSQSNADSTWEPATKEAQAGEPATKEAQAGEPTNEDGLTEEEMMAVKQATYDVVRETMYKAAAHADKVAEYLTSFIESFRKQAEAAAEEEQASGGDEGSSENLSEAPSADDEPAAPVVPSPAADEAVDAALAAGESMEVPEAMLEPSPAEGDLELEALLAELLANSDIDPAQLLEIFAGDMGGDPLADAALAGGGDPLADAAAMEDPAAMLGDPKLAQAVYKKVAQKVIRSTRHGNTKAASTKAAAKRTRTPEHKRASVVSRIKELAARSR